MHGHPDEGRNAGLNPLKHPPADSETPVGMSPFPRPEDDSRAVGPMGGDE